MSLIWWKKKKKKRRKKKRKMSKEATNKSSEDPHNFTCGECGNIVEYNKDLECSICSKNKEVEDHGGS